MIIKSLQLNNYRCFKDFSIDFDEQLTVLVGANGAGKTAILDALSLFLKWAGNPDFRKSRMISLSEPDIAINCKAGDVSYQLTLLLYPKKADSLVNLDIKFDEHFHYNMKGSDYKSYGLIGGSFSLVNPIFVTYMAGRLIESSNLLLKNNHYSPKKNSAFSDGFNRSIDYQSTISWFNSADADEARSMRDEGTTVEQPELKAVREALSKALLGNYEKPRMFGNPPELVVYGKDSNMPYKVSQLSDGYRLMLALIMDLARRMAQAQNDNHDSDKSLLNYPAIVLIDEVELHLHPSWQQTVLITLMEIFPNTQFIVTTHSPQVLTSIQSKHIRVLSDGKAFRVDSETQGAEASRILKQVFGVEQRPKTLDIVQDLNNYSKMVYDEKWDTPEAAEIRKRLSEHYGNDEPELAELDLHIENTKWERGL